MTSVIDNTTHLKCFKLNNNKDKNLKINSMIYLFCYKFSFTYKMILSYFIFRFFCLYSIKYISWFDISIDFKHNKSESSNGLIIEICFFINLINSIQTIHFQLHLYLEIWIYFSDLWRQKWQMNDVFLIKEKNLIWNLLCHCDFFIS